MAHILKHTATITGRITPATRPRYNAASIEDAIFAAARIAAKYTCPMYVYPRYNGFGITYRLAGLSVCESYVKVNGNTAEWYTKDYGPSAAD